MTEATTYGYNDARGGTPHAKYLRFANGAVGLRGKRVLEVGGCSPPNVIAKYQPKVWDCINLDSRAVESFNAMARTAGLESATAMVQDASKFEVTKAYDVVYSINAFEHIKPLDAAIERMKIALRPGGKLFSLYGPIWSCDVGHHLSVPTDVGELHFNDGVLAPWEHLTSTREQLHARLAARYSRKAADAVIEFIYDFPDLNRLYERDYLRIFAASGLSEVLLLRNNHGTPPPVDGATAARELMVVLKKGPKGLFEREWTLLRFALAFGWQKLSPV